MTSSQSITSTSSLSLSQPPPGSVPPLELFHLKLRWVRIEHAPSKRRGVEQSLIWDHGTDYLCVDDSNVHAWRCKYCYKDLLVVMKQESTTNVRRHLRQKHKLGFESKKRSREEFEEDNSSVQYSPVIRGLVSTVNVDTFRYCLTRWIVNRHIPFTEVEGSDFQALLKSLNGSVTDYLVKSGDTIRNWVEDDFIEAKKLIQEEVIARAISKIHVSCDLWTSPNGYAMCGVAAHFIGHQGYIQTVLLALRRVIGGHGGEQIAEILIEVITEYGFQAKLGVFVGDNADSNDTAWKATLRVLHPDRDSKASRSRCLGHIINLAAKAFIFGKQVEAFEAVVNGVDDTTPWDSQAMRNAQTEWRKKGPLGKIHNIVVFIRISTIRKEALRRITVDDLSDSKCPSISNCG